MPRLLFLYLFKRIGFGVLIVQFAQPLRADTEYTVEVAGVGALSRDATSTFRYGFTTAEASVLYLDRGETVDEVLRAPLSGTGRGEVVLADSCSRDRTVAVAAAYPVRIVQLMDPRDRKSVV